MSLIDFPADVPAEIQWALSQPTQINRSEWTRARSTTILAAKAMFRAVVSLPPRVGEKSVLKWRSFIAGCRGQANRFRLRACEGPQVRIAVTVRVNGAGQTGFTLDVDGWPGPGQWLREGNMVTVGEQLLILRADCVADSGGKATLTFEPYLRAAPADNAVIEVTRPYAVMTMADDENGWTVGRGQQYAISFGCEEA